MKSYRRQLDFHDKVSLCSAVPSSCVRSERCCGRARWWPSSGRVRSARRRSPVRSPAHGRAPPQRLTWKIPETSGASRIPRRPSHPCAAWSSSTRSNAGRSCFRCSASSRIAIAGPPASSSSGARHRLSSSSRPSRWPGASRTSSSRDSASPTSGGGGRGSGSGADIRGLTSPEPTRRVCDGVVT